MRSPSSPIIIPFEACAYTDNYSFGSPDSATNISVAIYFQVCHLKTLCPLCCDEGFWISIMHSPIKFYETTILLSSQLIAWNWIRRLRYSLLALNCVMKLVCGMEHPASYQIWCNICPVSLQHDQSDNIQHISSTNHMLCFFCEFQVHLACFVHTFV